MSRAIVPIVEGYAEVYSVPVLLRRMLEHLNAFQVQVARPFRVGRYRVVQLGEIERAVKLAVASRENVKGVLVLLDADDDCPAKLGPKLLKRCRRVISIPVSVVLAEREFEAWFLGAKESLRGVRGIRDDAKSPSSPESIRGAKERLSHNMQNLRYVEVDDQPALAKRMDLQLAKKRCLSFKKLLREVESLVLSMTGG